MLKNVLHDKDLFVVKRITGSYLTNDPVQRYTDSIADDAVRLFTEIEAEIEAEIVCNSCNYMAKAKMFKTVNYKTELHNQRNIACIMVQVQAVRSYPPPRTISLNFGNSTPRGCSYIPRHYSPYVNPMQGYTGYHTSYHAGM